MENWFVGGTSLGWIDALVLVGTLGVMFFIGWWGGRHQKRRLTRCADQWAPAVPQLRLAPASFGSAPWGMAPDYRHLQAARHKLQLRVA